MVLAAWCGKVLTCGGPVSDGVGEACVGKSVVINLTFGSDPSNVRRVELTTYKATSLVSTAIQWHAMLGQHNKHCVTESLSY